MRRSDRKTDRKEALRILSTGEYGVLSTVSPDNQPYGLPLNFCVINEFIYFHSSTEGHKIDNFTQNPKVSFCVIGNTNILPAKFSTEFESTIVFGLLTEVFDDEKQQALEGLVNKYSPEYCKEGLKYIESMTKKTKVFKIEIKSITGKSRKKRN